MQTYFIRTTQLLPHPVKLSIHSITEGGNEYGYLSHGLHDVGMPGLHRLQGVNKLLQRGRVRFPGLEYAQVLKTFGVPVLIIEKVKFNFFHRLATVLISLFEKYSYI